MTILPSNRHITYALQYRKCGKQNCATCRNGRGHGPYWYAYWRDAATQRQRVGYLGKAVSSDIAAAFARQQGRKEGA